MESSELSQMTATGAEDKQASLTARLAEWARTLDIESIPPQVVDTAKLAIIDNIACLLGGSGTSLARAARAATLDGGRPEATVAGESGRYPAAQAAFVNAVAASALDYDDCYEQNGKGMGHPGTSLVAAALAMGEAHGRGGADVLTAIIAGYESCNRVVESIQPSPERYAQVGSVGIHQTFGAAVVAGRLARLERQPFLDAFGLAGMFTAVPAARKWNWNSRPLAWIKDMVTLPAEMGIRGVRLAQAGYVGGRDILDGPTGFWMMAGSDQFDPDRLTDRLGDRWTVLDLAFKPYPACRWIHTTLEAVEGLVAEHGLAPPGIAEIAVGSFDRMTDSFADYEPASMIDAEFSVPYTVAVALHRVPLGPEWYADETLRSAEILATARKVRLYTDEEAQRRWFRPDRQSSAVVTIIDRAGREYSRRISVARGGAALPGTRDTVMAKFDALAAGYGGTSFAGELRQALERLEEVAHIRELTSLIASARKGDQ